MKRWPIKPLGELVLPTEQRDPRANPLDEFLYIDIASVDNQTKRIIATKQIVGAEAPSRARKVIRDGDILVSTVRPNLNAVALVTSDLDNQICSTGFSVLRPSEKVLSGYLFAFVRSPTFVEYLIARTTGANYPAVNDGEVKDVPVPLPPLAEQERIVKLLDEADELRKLRAQADRRSADLIPALFNEMFGDPIAEKSGWMKRPLGELATRITKGESPGWQGFEYTTEGPMFITSENVLWGSLNVIDPKRIPAAFHEKLSRSMVQANDVLLNLVGASIGRCCLVPSDLGEANINQAVAVISSDEQILPDFLVSLLLSQDAQNYFYGGKVEGARANISLGDVRKYETIVPPLSLQKEFAQRVGEIRALQAAQAASRERTEHLFQSMLHRAFSQEL